MRHKVETADSDRYDRRVHDRLNECAVRFCERVAGKYSAAPVPEGWALLDAPSFEFVKGEAGFACAFDWFDALRAGATYRWASVPGLADGFTWQTPADASAVGKRLSLTLPSCDVQADRFTVANLLVKQSAAPAAPAAPAVAPTEVIDEATRTEGDAFRVTLPADPRLTGGCEVRIVDAGVVEQTFPAAPSGAADEVTVRLPECGEARATLSGLEVRGASPVASVRPQSQVKPAVPRAEALSKLARLHFHLGEAARSARSTTRPPPHARAPLTLPLAPPRQTATASL